MAPPKGFMPPNAGKGRPKGIPNVYTKTIKEMVLAALDGVGGIKYLKQQAIDNPGPFLTLIGKVLPTDINAHHTGTLTLAALVEQATNAALPAPMVIEHEPESEDR